MSGEVKIEVRRPIDAKLRRDLMMFALAMRRANREEAMRKAERENTPSTATAAAQSPLRIRRRQIMAHVNFSGSDFMPIRLFDSGSESFYVVVQRGRYGKLSESSANRFRELLSSELDAGEYLELHLGRIVICGQNGAYRIHFNFEGCGKHAGFTADFRDPSCPIVKLGRISIRMLRHQVRCARNSPPPGMFDPRIMERIPDPADRYASLLLKNHKLFRRVPRAIIEELENSGGD